MENTDLLLEIKESIKSLQNEISQLRTELESYTKNNNTRKVNSEDITRESVLNCRVSISKDDYRKEYSNISELLNNEGLYLEPTISGGVNGLVNLLRYLLKKGNDIPYITLNKYKIEFYFD